jgi:hypothetical protein
MSASFGFKEAVLATGITAFAGSQAHAGLILEGDAEFDNIAQVTINGETLTADSVSVFIRNDFFGLNNISWSITDFDQTFGGNVIDRLTFNGTGVISDDLFDNFGQLDTAILSLQGVGNLTAAEASATIETKVNEVPEGPGLPLVLTGLALLAYSRREQIAQSFAPAQPA